MIEAKVIERSVSPDDVELCTIQAHYHRFIHSEIMTHRVFSRSASSSRAVPLIKRIKQVWTDPAIPVHWGKNQPGMQADNELPPVRRAIARFLWVASGRLLCLPAYLMFKLGLHKQVAARMLEPWQWIDVVITATDWENFFELRRYSDAQPEMQVLAEAIWQAMESVAPTPLGLGYGDWHLPYLVGEEREREDAPILSAARCARVSYSLHDGTAPSVKKDKQLFKRLAQSRPAHLSPLEHQARVSGSNLTEGSRNFRGDWRQFREIFEEQGFAEFEPIGSTVQETWGIAAHNGRYDG